MQVQHHFLCIRTILLWVLFLQLSQTAPSPPIREIISILGASTAPLLPAPSSPPASPSSPSSPSSSSTNLTSVSGASNGRCATRTTFPAWYASNWLIEDCYAAVQQLYLKETMLHPNQEYEFLQSGFSRKDPHIPSQATPRKYVVGTCTLTVMLLNWWGPGSLPSPMRPIPVTHTDTSTYQKIWAAAKGLELACPDIGAPGWCVAGDKNAMGVFIWATNSDINSRVKGWPIVELPGANFSVSDAIDIGQTS